MSGARNGVGGGTQAVAHYVRISSEEQKKGYSTRDQRRKLEEHSEREGHEVVMEPRA